MSGSGNSGIQISGGGSVNADVLAVGDNATANKTVHEGNGVDTEQVIALISGLREAMLAEGMNEKQIGMLDADFQAVASEAQSEEPDKDKVNGLLSGIVEKLSFIGLAADTSEVLGIVGKVAAGFGLSMAGIL
jgi:hypothetical protein